MENKLMNVYQVLSIIAGMSLIEIDGNKDEPVYYNAEEIFRAIKDCQLISYYATDITQETVNQVLICCGKLGLLAGKFWSDENGIRHDSYRLNVIARLIKRYQY